MWKTMTLSRTSNASADWVEIWNCNSLHEAAFLKSVLESEGIKALLPDEYTVGVQPFYIAALGGVRLMVRASDAGRAKELIESAADLPHEE
jgi:hypothetical protein